jgi:hypothetical protein
VPVAQPHRDHGHSGHGEPHGIHRNSDGSAEELHRASTERYEIVDHNNHAPAPSEHLHRAPQATAATARPGPLQDWYQERLAGGMRAELARVTLTRKLAALTLRLWKTGERFDPAQLTRQAH